MAALAVALLGGLLILRALQLLSLAPGLYDGEFLQLGRLAAEQTSNGIPVGFSFSDLSGYGYMPHAQGTLLIVLATLALAQVVGANVWALHGVAIALELLTVGLALTLFLRVGGMRRAVPATLLWLVPPSFAVVWQLMPFGTHSDFLWVGVGAALLLSRASTARPARGTWPALTLLLALGVVAYRANLVVLLAVATAALLGSERRAALRALVACGVAALLAVVLLAVAVDRNPGEPLRGLIFPHFGYDTWPLFEQLRSLPRRFPSSPAAAGSGWPHLILLGACAVVAGLLGLRRGQPHRLVLLFASAWMLGSTSAALIGGARYSQYFLPAHAAGLLCVGLLICVAEAGLSRRLAGGLLALLLVAGAVDAASLIQPARWSASLRYDGLAVFQGLGLTAAGEDDLPWLARVVREDRGTADFRRGFPESGCHSPLRSLGARESTPDPRGRCRCWEPGQLAAVLDAARSGGEISRPGDLGRGAWIGCDRDLAAVRAALEGASPAEVEAVVAGALSEAALPPL